MTEILKFSANFLIASGITMAFLGAIGTIVLSVRPHGCRESIVTVGVTCPIGATAELVDWSEDGEPVVRCACPSVRP